MENKKYIKLNTGNNYLSFGNLFRVIKEESISSNTFLQPALFSIIFNTENIADSTVNNYCTGLRAINTKYKSYFENLKDKYKSDKDTFVKMIGKIIELIDAKVYNLESLTITKINKVERIKNICKKLYTIAKNDSDVDIKLENKLFKYLKSENYYSFLVEVLFYTILVKRQPITVRANVTNIIENNIYNTNIAVEDVNDFIKLQLNSGIWSIREIKALADKNNPFACFELASMEYYGIITGKPRYEIAYNYYLIAAKHKHPVANWAIGYLYYNGNIGTRSKRDLFLAFSYFNKGRKLKCSNAFNSLGLIFLNGDIPHIRKNEKKAIDFFNIALSMKNIYAYNNLGKIYESKKEYKKAYKYYIQSANLGESWAANKIGEFYRKGLGVKKDFTKAFEYYTKSSESINFTLCKWSKYNLAKYFYLTGNVEANINKNINMAISLLEEIDLLESMEELIYIYYDLYLKSNKENKYYLEKIIYYKKRCEKDDKYDLKIKNNIENRIQKLSKKYEINLDFSL